MNKVVNLMSVKAEKEQGVKELQSFIQAAVEMNLDQVTFTIAKDKKSSDQIINTYTDFLISQAFSNYSQQELVLLISSGVLFQAREQLKDAFIEGLTKQAVI
ncbi:hypothetical protein [Metabacillus sp. cB07]|uniref:hypothetical protein n=1 Tax=Metabacillus sp. cB07 TaxID=2806989 RepID=UPI00193959A0|nr:hypothetical protein [Metabacillus sp. cB07]